MGHLVCRQISWSVFQNPVSCSNTLSTSSNKITVLVLVVASSLGVCLCLFCDNCGLFG